MEIAPQLMLMELIIILWILFVKHHSQEFSLPQSCVAESQIWDWQTLQNYSKSKYLVKGTGEKAEWADERYSPNEGNPVQMKRSLHLQALGTAGIIIPRFKR